MDKMDYVDLLLHKITTAETLQMLLYIQDDIDMAKGLGDLTNKQDLRLLKVAAESRYSYIIFKQVLFDLEKLLEMDGSPKLTLVRDFESKLDK